RDAILSANANPGTDEIVFKSATGGVLKGSITLASDLPPITDSVTIHDTAITKLGRSSNITINGNKHALFNIKVASPTDVTLEGLTLKNGKSNNGGAIYLNDDGGNLVIQNCIISGNHALGASGVANATYGYIAKGGAVDIEKGSVTVITSKITGNSAVGGIGGAGYYGGKALGGAFYVGTSGKLSIQSSTISGNTAQGGNGGNGAKGDAGTHGDPGSAGSDGYDGGYGGNGGHAFGGGVCNFGSATIQSSIISGNAAKAGNGGNGGAGGNGGSGGAGYSDSDGKHHGGIGGIGGNGGKGGNGGNASGGGVYSSSYVGGAGTCSLSIMSSSVTGNTTVFGKAGAAGLGGKAGASSSYYTDLPASGTAGTAGTTGFSNGGGIFSYGSAMNLSDIILLKNKAAQSADFSISLTPGLYLGTV